MITSISFRDAEFRKIQRKLEEVEGFVLQYDGFDSHCVFFISMCQTQAFKVFHTTTDLFDYGDVYECDVEVRDWYFYHNLVEEHEFLLAREEA